MAVDASASAFSDVVTPKIRSPRRPPRSVARRRLLDVLRTGGDARCVAVHGGPGYGKTTLLRQWIDDDPRATAWVSLDAGDDDPVVLLTHVVRALHEAVPLPEVEAALRTRPPDLEGVVLPALEAALETVGRPPVLLVLDDVHRVGSAAAVAALGRLLDLTPEGSTVVLSGRSLPAVHLARRALAGEVLELDEPALAFTPEEAREALAGALPDLDATIAATVLEQVAGWPGGLALVALALANAEDPGVALDGLVRDRFMRSYFEEELLAGLPASTRDVLLRSSVLPRLSGPLCDAVLDRTGTAALLEELAAASHFVSGLEGGSGWYRFHPLFADLLADELTRADPAGAVELQRRAARWFAAAGEPDTAVDLAVRSQDLDLAAEVVYAHLFPALDLGRLASVARWLAAFPAAEVSRRPPLMVAAGWLAFYSGRRDEVAEWLTLLEPLTADTVMPDQGPGLELARAALSMTAGLGGALALLRDAEIVRAHGPEGNPWWPLAVHFEVLGRLLTGRLPPEEQVEAMTRARLAVQGTGTTHAVVTAQAAMVHLRLGDAARGQELIAEAVAELVALGLEGYWLGGMIHGVSAYAAARRGDGAGAERAMAFSEAADRATGGVLPRATIQLRLLLADAALLLGDHATAAGHLAIAERSLPAEPDAVLLHDWCGELRARLEVVEPAVVAQARYGITPSELRVLEQLASHRSLQEIADLLYLSRNTIKSHTISLYRKLGVSGRSAAVELAMEVELLAGLDSPHRDDDTGRRPEDPLRARA